MPSIYVSSTFLDLQEHRQAVDRALRRLAHDVRAMEDYVAADERPLARCLADVAACDVYVGIIAWRYGYVPAHDNPAHSSITELEYREATRLNKPRLIFLLSEDAPWQPRFVDKGEAAERLHALRQALTVDHLASTFKTKEELAELVGAAITQWEKAQREQAKERSPRGRREVPSWSPIDILRATERFSAISRRKVGGRYKPELYVPREQDQRLFDTLRAPLDRVRMTVLVERAGSGKTNLVCRLTELLLAEQRPTILILGSEPITSPSALTAQVLTALGWPEAHEADALAAALEHFTGPGDRTLYLLIDALNEARDVDLLKAALGHLLASIADARVSILATCRDIYWSFVKGPWLEIVPTSQLSLDMYRFEWGTWPAVRQKYFQAYSIAGQLSAEAEDTCRHPLLFRFFCEAYEGDDISIVRDIRLKPLFDRYLTRKVERIAHERRRLLREDERVVRILEGIAAELVETREVSLPEARMPALTGEPEHLSADSLYVRLLDEDIMIEEVPDPVASGLKRRVRFVYEAFLEYMIARVIVSRWRHLTNEAIVESLAALLEPTASMHNTLGALTFLEEFFIERQLMYWRAFMQRGHAWQAMAVRALRETHPEDMNVLHKDALAAGLELGTPDVRREILEILSEDTAHAVLDPAYEAVLQTMAHDPRLEIRLAALEILKERWDTLDAAVRVRACQMAWDRSKEVRRTSLPLLGRLTGPERRTFFVELHHASRSDSGPTRSYAIFAANVRRFPMAKQMLGDALADPYQWVRRAALIRLMDSKPDEALIPSIVACLADPEPQVRSRAASLCGKWRTPPLRDALHARLGLEEDGRVLSWLVRALTEIDPEVEIETYGGLLDHPNKFVRRHATRALYQSRGLDALPLLIQSFERRDEVKWSKGWPSLDDMGGEMAILKLCRTGFVHARLARADAAFMAGRGSAMLFDEKVLKKVAAWLRGFLVDGPEDLVRRYLRGWASTSEWNARPERLVSDVSRTLVELVLKDGPNAEWAAYLVGAYASVDAISMQESDALLALTSVEARRRLAQGIAREGSPFAHDFDPAGLEQTPNADDDIPF